MEHLKTRLETIGLSFDDGSKPESDSIEENPVRFDRNAVTESDRAIDSSSIEQIVSVYP